MKLNSPLFLLLLLFPFLACSAQTDSKQPTSNDKTVQAVVTPTPKVNSAQANNINRSSSTIKALVVHKPMPSPSWGRVIQYHREENFVLSDKNRETLHEFLFQDDAGVVRTAVYHENASGDGYWEVWVWDQP